LTFSHLQTQISHSLFTAENLFKIVIRRTKVVKQYLLNKYKQLKLKICKS